MNETITLQELVGYLPFELKWINPTFGADAIPVKLPLRMVEHVFDDIAVFRHYKPLLLPLSFLTKEIEHKGRKFTPMEWIRQEWQDEHHIGLIDAHAHWDYIKTLFQDGLILELPNWVIERLRGWHFDIHNLIERDLAIDKSTLNQ